MRRRSVAAPRNAHKDVSILELPEVISMEPKLQSVDTLAIEVLLAKEKKVRVDPQILNIDAIHGVSPREENYVQDD